MAWTLPDGTAPPPASSPGGAPEPSSAAPLSSPLPLGQAAFFDLDKTIIARVATAAFGGPLRKRGLGEMLFHFAWIVFAANFLIFLGGPAADPRLLPWLATLLDHGVCGDVAGAVADRADSVSSAGQAGPTTGLAALGLGYVVRLVGLAPSTEYAMAGRSGRWTI